MYPDDADVAAVRDAMFDPFEYFVLRKKDGLLKTDFKQRAGQGLVPHPLPFARAEHGPEDARDARGDSRHRGHHRGALLGHDGTWGVKTEYFDNSMKIGRPVFRQMADAGAQYVSSDARSPRATSCRAWARRRRPR